MVRKIKVIYAVILLALLVPVSALAWPGKVIEVTDGDTLTVQRNDQEVDVRLYGIDCPETDQPYGHRATRFTKMMARFERVEIEPQDRDQYGRVVALVYIDVDGECLNEELVTAGHVWVYERYCHIRDCDHWQRLERRARQAERGLWAGDNPVPPWNWRQGKRNGSSFSGNTAAGEDKDCTDFDTQAEAQRFYEAHQPGDPHRLDGNNDGEAYESLP